MSRIDRIADPHGGQMVSPWTRDMSEPRDLSAEELAVLRAIREAEQRIEEAVHLIRSAPQLPARHAAVEYLDGFVADARWTVDAYLAEARAAIEALPEAERQAAEDARSSGENAFMDGEDV